MTDQEFDIMLRAALLEAQRRRWEPVISSGPDLEWTPARQKVMDKVLADPFGYGKRWASPKWRRVLGRVGQAAACLLLVGTLTLTFSPTARAWAANVVRGAVEWLDTHTRITYSGDTAAELETWRPTYLPEGFEEVGVLETEARAIIRYENEAGDYISLDYMLAQQGSMNDFDNEHSDYEALIWNGQPAHFFRSNTEGWPSSLIWYDEAGTTAFQIIAYTAPEEVLKIAESVEILEP